MRDTDVLPAALRCVCVVIMTAVKCNALCISRRRHHRLVRTCWRRHIVMRHSLKSVLYVVEYTHHSKSALQYGLNATMPWIVSAKPQVADCAM